MWSQFFGKREKGEGFNETVVLLCWWNPPCKGWTFWSKGKNIFGGYGLFGFKSLGTLLVEKEKKMNPKGDGFIKTVVLSNVPWGGKTVVPFKTQNRRPREDGKTVVLFGDHTIILFECFSFFGHQFKGAFLVKKGLGRKPGKNWPMVLQLSFSHQLIYIYILHYMMSQHNNMQISL